MEIEHCQLVESQGLYFASIYIALCNMLLCYISFEEPRQLLGHRVWIGRVNIKGYNFKLW